MRNEKRKVRQYKIPGNYHNCQLQNKQTLFFIGQDNFYIMKILLVDDNQEITLLLSKFLISKGFEIVVANDPIEGLRCIQQEQYDVILLDISMPEISGINIIDTLATDEILKDQNIFIFSANTLSEIQIKDLLRKDGINGCLQKPVQLSEILTTITN